MKKRSLALQAKDLAEACERKDYWMCLFLVSDDR